MKAVVEAPHRPTMQQIQARRRSSTSENRLTKRLGMSLPNLRVDQTISIQRNTPLSRILVPDPGETCDQLKMTSKTMSRQGKKSLLFLTSSSLFSHLSPSTENTSQACKGV